MQRYSIANIASIITEDPDILAELDSSMDQSMEEPAGGDPAVVAATPPEPEKDRSVVEPKIGDEKPLQAAEVEKQAEEIAGENPDQQITDQIKAQEEAQMAMDMERRKLLEPQMAKLNADMDSLGTGITQGLAGAQAGGEAFSNLDSQMASINAIIGQLEKQLY